MVDKYEVSVRWHHIMLSAVLLASTASAEAENKWVWSGNGRSISDGGSASAYYPGEADRPRYRPPAPVYEVTDFTNTPPILQPSRPGSTPPNNYGPVNFPRPGGPGIITGPDNLRPGGPGIITGPDNLRPGGPGIITGPDNLRPGGPGIITGPDNLRPGRPGILTGPVPSWEQHPGDKFAYKDYEHCKCAYSFNCASPGIKFGHCDSDKQYCCYNSKPISNGGQPPFNRGPGYIDPSVKPTYDRPVLVGPGGPTGIVSEGGRPFKLSGGLYRPFVREDIDEDYRPYQGYGAINDEHFPRPPYDPYARSANIEAKKNGKKL